MIRAAGGVVWRRLDDVVEVVLVHRPRYDDWSLPKGKLDPGESHLAAARREVHEETGARTAVGRRLGESRYLVMTPEGLVPKVVLWWALEAIGGSFHPSREVDELRWLPVDAAVLLLGAGHDAAPLRRFAQHPPATTLVLLVRHASAGKRGSWDGADDDRPLDAKGLRQAAALAVSLADYDPVRVLSAPLRRCLDTVGPLAAHLGCAVEPEPLLADAAHDVDPVRSARTVLSLGRAAGPVVACSQGETIPAVVERLSARSGQAPEDLRTRKAATWALVLHDGRLLDAELLPPPP